MTADTHLPEVVSPEEWLAARKDLLVKEKEATRARDRVNADRRRLPMVRIDKPYTFEGPDGTVGLLGLFGSTTSSGTTTTMSSTRCSAPTARTCSIRTRVRPSAT